MSASPFSTGASTFPQLGGIVLTVAVAADDDVVAALRGVLETCLHGTADAEVERQPDDVRAVRRGDLGRAVDRAVGDDDDFEVRGRDARSSSITLPMLCSSLNAGTIGDPAEALRAQPTRASSRSPISESSRRAR